MKQDLVSKSKFLSLVLRHCPKQIGITLDDEGWTIVDDLLVKANMTLDELKEIVETNDKKRFEFDTLEIRIRACQGHSVQVDLNLAPQTPPDQLFHGTSTKSMNAILQSGLSKMNRTHVHLSETEQTAKKVGARHGKPVVLEVSAKQMSDDGIMFYKSTNGVWLTDFVDKKYLSVKW